MSSPGKQFERIMKTWANKALSKMAVELSDEVVRQMHINVDRGESFDGEAYNSQYAERTKKDRKRLGFQTSRVDLQRSRRRIKQTHTQAVAKGVARTRFKPNTDRKGQTAGVIMFAHHNGVGNLPVRRIFPTRKQTVPNEALEKAAAKGLEVFNEL